MGSNKTNNIRSGKVSSYFRAKPSPSLTTPSTGKAPEQPDTNQRASNHPPVASKTPFQELSDRQNTPKQLLSTLNQKPTKCSGAHNSSSSRTSASPASTKADRKCNVPTSRTPKILNPYDKGGATTKSTPHTKIVNPYMKSSSARAHNRQQQPPAESAPGGSRGAPSSHVARTVTHETAGNDMSFDCTSGTTTRTRSTPPSISSTQEIEMAADDEEMDRICSKIPMNSPMRIASKQERQAIGRVDMAAIDKRPAAGGNASRSISIDSPPQVETTSRQDSGCPPSPNKTCQSNDFASRQAAITDAFVKSRGKEPAPHNDLNQSEVVMVDPQNDDDDDEEEYDIGERDKLSQSLTQPDINWSKILQDFSDAEAGISRSSTIESTNSEVQSKKEEPTIAVVRERGEKRKRSEPETPTKTLSSKKAKIPNQPSISTFLRPATTQKAPQSSPYLQLAPSSKMWEYNGRTYKKGDVWKCNVSKLKGKTRDQEEFRKLEGFFFTIGDCSTHKTRLQSVSVQAIHILLTDTFLGPKYGLSLAKSRQQQIGISVPDKASYITEILPDDGKTIFTRLLTEKHSSAPPGCHSSPALTSELVYELSKRRTNSQERKKKNKDTKSISLKEEACAFYYNHPVKRTLDVSKRRNKKPTALDIFSGAGGMALGLVEAGFDVTHHVDMNRDCCSTIERNFKAAIVIPECIRIFFENCKQGRAKVYPQPGDFDHIHGSPPCQGFSEAHNGGVNDDHNNSLTIDLVHTILYFRPATFTIENVLGMAQDSRGRKDYLQRTMFMLVEAGYQVRLCVLTASDYGDPQTRERIILFGAMKGFQLPNIPQATHGDSTPGLLEVQTCADVLKVLEDIEPTDQSGIVELPNGKLVRDHCLNGQSSNDREQHLVSDKPAKTVLRERPVMHYSSKRQQVTIRELALLQSFPIDYLFSGDWKSLRGQIGNAVPVRLACAIAKAVMDSFSLGCATY